MPYRKGLLQNVYGLIFFILPILDDPSPQKLLFLALYLENRDSLYDTMQTIIFHSFEKWHVMLFEKGSN